MRSVIVKFGGGPVVIEDTTVAGTVVDYTGKRNARAFLYDPKTGKPMESMIDKATGSGAGALIDWAAGLLAPNRVWEFKGLRGQQ